MALTVAQAMGFARNYLKVESGYASSEEIRLANTIQSIVTAYHRWNWSGTAGSDISISLAVQDYSMVAGDQNKVQSIENAYLTDASNKYAQLLTYSDQQLPVTDTTGRPFAVGLLSPTQFRFWPSPNATYTLKWRYHKRPVVFTGNTESWDIPEAFTDVVKFGLCWQLADYADDDRSESLMKQFYSLLEKQKDNDLVTGGRKR